MAQRETDLVVEGIDLPPAGTWTFDKAHTSLEFVARHMLSKVRGRFTGFDGTVVIAERPEESSVEVRIDASSIQTNQEFRDNHLRSEDFLGAETWPELTFRSTGFRHKGGNAFELLGDLTIRDITREVVLDAEFLGWGSGAMADSPPLAAFTARTVIDREDWDMTWNAVVETGGFLVGKKVTLEIEAELTLAA